MHTHAHTCTPIILTMTEMTHHARPCSTSKDTNTRTKRRTRTQHTDTTRTPEEHALRPHTRKLICTPHVHHRRGRPQQRVDTPARQTEENSHHHLTHHEHTTMNTTERPPNHTHARARRQAEGRDVQLQRAAAPSRRNQAHHTETAQPNTPQASPWCHSNHTTAYSV